MEIKQYKRAYEKLKPFIKKYLEGFWKEFDKENPGAERVEITDEMVEQVIGGLSEINPEILIDFFETLGLIIVVDYRNGGFIGRIEGKTIEGMSDKPTTRLQAKLNIIEAAFKYYEANGE